jgi:hypothetical protein
LDSIQKRLTEPYKKVPSLIKIKRSLHSRLLSKIFDFGTGASQKNVVFLEGRNRKKKLRFFGILSFFLRKKERIVEKRKGFKKNPKFF